MFGNNRKRDMEDRLRVIETRNENLTVALKAMCDSLDGLSENSANVSKLLAVHEEILNNIRDRIKQIESEIDQQKIMIDQKTDKSSQIRRDKDIDNVVGFDRNLIHENTDKTEALKNNIHRLENKIEALTQYKWIMRILAIGTVFFIIENLGVENISSLFGVVF